MKKWIYLVPVAALFAWLSMHGEAQAVNPRDVSNGWYRGLAPVTAEMVKAPIACLLAELKDEGFDLPDPELYAEPVGWRTPGWPDLTPAEIHWTYQGRRASTDAVMTYYGPQVAFVDIVRELRLPIPLDSYRWTCEYQKEIPTVGTVENPIGDPWPEKGGEWYRSNLKDKFTPGARYTDQRGTFLKKSGGVFVFGWSGWELQKGS